MIAELKKLIKPSHFIKWLKMEEYPISGVYSDDVYNMCQIGSLFISMILSKSPYKARFNVHSVLYRYVNHYFVSYIHDGNEIVIDLTISQFDDKQPKLLIKPLDEVYEIYGRNTMLFNISEFIENCDGFYTYIDPNTMTKPKGWYKNPNEAFDWKNNKQIEIKLISNLEGFIL